MMTNTDQNFDRDAEAEKQVDLTSEAIDAHQSMVESRTDRRIALNFIRPIDSNVMTIAEME